MKLVLFVSYTIFYLNEFSAFYFSFNSWVILLETRENLTRKLYFFRINLARHGNFYLDFGFQCCCNFFWKSLEKKAYRFDLQTLHSQTCTEFQGDIFIAYGFVGVDSYVCERGVEMKRDLKLSIHTCRTWTDLSCSKQYLLKDSEGNSDRTESKHQKLTFFDYHFTVHLLVLLYPMVFESGRFEKLFATNFTTKLLIRVFSLVIGQIIFVFINSSTMAVVSYSFVVHLQAVPVMK